MMETTAHAPLLAAAAAGTLLALGAVALLRRRDLETRVDRWERETRAARARPHGEEKAKMIAGETYVSSAEQLALDRDLSHDGCALFNRLALSEHEDLRKRVIHALLDNETVHVEPPFHVDYGYNLKCGAGVYFNFNCIVLDSAPITIGDSTMFGPGCQLVTPNHPLKALERHSPPFPEIGGPISIGKQCWFGAGVVVCPGVTIGDGCVIAAGSVVVRDIPDGCLAAGCPAKVLRENLG